MAIVYLQDDNIKVSASDGKTIRQIAQRVGASMEFGCRVGDCLTCIATIKDGMEHLSPKNSKEIKALEMLGSDARNLRLMCQCSIEGEGEIVISYSV